MDFGFKSSPLNLFVRSTFLFFLHSVSILHLLLFLDLLFYLGRTKHFVFIIRGSMQPDASFTPDRADVGVLPDGTTNRTVHAEVREQHEPHALPEFAICTSGPTQSLSLTTCSLALDPCAR
jgi:hypothetical protein